MNVAIGCDRGTRDRAIEQSCKPRLASRQPRRDDVDSGRWLLLAWSIGGAVAGARLAALLLMLFKLRIGFHDSSIWVWVLILVFIYIFFNLLGNYIWVTVFWC